MVKLYRRVLFLLPPYQISNIIRMYLWYRSTILFCLAVLGFFSLPVHPSLVDVRRYVRNLFFLLASTNYSILHPISQIRSVIGSFQLSFVFIGPNKGYPSKLFNMVLKYFHVSNKFYDLYAKNKSFATLDLVIKYVR